MANFCSCSDGISNFGQPICVDSFGRDARLVFVQYADSSGAVNSIKSGDFVGGVLNAAYFSGKLYDTDKTQRWYLTEVINSVESVREDNVTQDIDGIPFNVKQGTRNYSGMFYGGIASPKYAGVLESMGCAQMGYFIIDVNGNIIGSYNDVTGELDPIKIQRNTFQIKYSFPSVTEVQSVAIKFSIEENERDADLSYVPSDEITADLFALRSMLDATIGAATSISVTGAVFTMSYAYGSAFTAQPLTGLVVGDFTLAETSPTPGAITITSITESTTVPGSYTMVFPTATSADVLQLTFTKTGFESTPISITIP